MGKWVVEAKEDIKHLTTIHRKMVVFIAIAGTVEDQNKFSFKKEVVVFRALREKRLKYTDQGARVQGCIDGWSICIC